MSTECARGFLLRMKSDLDFFFRVAAIEDAGERLAYIRSQGFDCTAEEIAESFSSPHDLPPEVDRQAWKGHLPPDPGFDCEIERVARGGVVITVKGELDLATAEQFRDAMSTLDRQGSIERLAVDLTGCSFIDSTGITVLIEAQRAATSPLIVAVRAAQNRRALQVAGLDSVFVIRESRDEALAELEKQGETT